MLPLSGIAPIFFVSFPLTLGPLLLALWLTLGSLLFTRYGGGLTLWPWLFSLWLTPGSLLLLTRWRLELRSRLFALDYLR
jgi:hypothetical protein